MPKPFFTKLVAISAIGFFCVLFGCIFGIEYAFSLEKNIKLLEGHRYRLYFRKPQQGTGQSMPCAGDILGYEELTDQLPELPDTSV